VELLTELFWEVLEQKTFGINTPPTGKPLFSRQNHNSEMGVCTQNDSSDTHTYIASLQVSMPNFCCLQLQVIKAGHGDLYLHIYSRNDMVQRMKIPGKQVP